MSESRIIDIPHSRPTISETDINAAISVLKSEHLEAGYNVNKLENNFKEVFFKSEAISVANGFAAIHLSLIAFGVGKDAEVIIPSYVCSALLNPIKILGAKPVIIDVAENSFNISVEEVEKRINKKTKAIIVPHIFGFPADIDILKSFGIPILEDCAQAIGGTYKNELLGTFGDISIFSFYASKMIAAGDGGMIVTDNQQYAETIKNYRYYGHKKQHRFNAYNYQLTNLPAAIADAQLSRIGDFIKRRKEIANMYDQIFNSINLIDISFHNKVNSCYYRYPIRLNNLEWMKSELKKSGIHCGYGVLEGLHQLVGLSPSNFENTEYNLKTILSIPIYPSLTNDEVEYIGDKISKLANI
ncbi:MAG: DegT/DnrJ/EryC1/StrS family aminotransferase [Sphingobacteriales bacterium]|jgi:perosamine synthetase|nr:DegT/DnrJ/EryC1/StrS family aminotransferase [Sphingobacteriales bacterium]